MTRRLYLSAACITVVLASMGQTRTRLRFTVALSSTPGLLTTSHISCEAKFRIATPVAGGNNLSAQVAGNTRPTMRYDAGDGKRHYFSTTLSAAIWESVEPTFGGAGTNCATANASTDFATAPTWGTGPNVPTNFQGDAYGSNWGYPPFVSSANCDGLPFENTFAPHGCTTSYAALKADPVLNKMMFFWMEGYAGSGNIGKPTFGAATMNFTTHTFEPYGCWNSNVGMSDQQQGSGMMVPPASWVTAHSALLPAGDTTYWITGLGGAVGYDPALSKGPSLAIVKVPTSGNACASGVSYPVASSAVLSLYQSQSGGPNCVGVFGCDTSGIPPTHPYSNRTSFTGYTGLPGYNDWNPYGGVGYFGTGTLFGMDWFHGSVYDGIVMPIVVQSGYRQGTVQSSPAPTYDSGTRVGTFTVTDVTTHDGYSINQFDNIWVTTCVAGVGPGCDPAQNDFQTIAYVVSVSGSGPYTITYHAQTTDVGSGDHVPVVGGTWQFGPTYGHGDGGATLPRGMARLQIYDPNEYVKVLNGTYATPDLPIYTEDIDAVNLFPGLGGPASGHGVSMGIGANAFTFPFSVTTDNAHDRIIVAFGNFQESCALFHDCTMVYVLKVQ